ncbi:MAG: phenylalanine--tRNA ligase subunit beta [Coriobacteriales bacterium]|nr:phenylalanine--tRNA ligase subunit beta [Coriobacteriales bacterium]
MLVSLKWLNEFIDVDLPTEELVDRLDLTGTAVESVKKLGEAMEGIVVGQIVEKNRHPDADKLWVTVVDVGFDEFRSIVCGAQNFEAGDKVPVALPGATLPGGITIKKTKLRGVTSEGMNCSAAELGLAGDSSGLLILPEDAPVGMPFAEYHGSADTVLELEITPNRPDCLSMLGVAREIGAILDRPYRTPGAVPSETGAPAADEVRVAIDDPDLCPRYTARLIRGVKVGPSPEWLVERITASGARPVNNVVDITNYVLFELGQPLHAFDAATLGRDGDGKIAISVRRASAGEKLTTLDGVERALTESDLVIADPKGAVALAGVMGGADTEVSDETVDVLLESAAFASASTSRTSRSLGLISEASMRFERGVDRTGNVTASDEAAALIAQIAGGEVAPGVVDAYPVPYESVTRELRMARLNAVLGTTISPEEATAILKRLGAEVEGGPHLLSVTPPSFRPDLEREIDLVEEVVRVWGMERVPSTLPAGRGRIGGLTPEQRWRERAGESLRACGLNETMTYAFVDPADHERIGHALEEGEVLVELLNPMSAEQAVMRRSLLPGLLRSVSFNQRRGVENVHLYEIGSVFQTTDGRKQPKEHTRITGVLAGAWHPAAWNAPAVPLDIFDGKGVLENLARELGVERLGVREAARPWLQPGRSAEVVIGKNVIGWLGEVYAPVLETFDAQGPVTAFELDMAALAREARGVRELTDVPRHPAVELDVAIVVDEDVTALRIEQSMRSAGGKLLDNVRLFDVYRGKGVPEGRKSMAYALSYRAPDRTLTAEEVEGVHAKLVRKVTSAVGGELRG